MRQYYYYWEKKIFNAITRMVIRALATNKALLTKTGKPMIKMTATYNHPEMSYHPTKEELRTQLDKFNRNILDSTKKFGRWWDGYCKVFDPIPDKDSSEQSIPFTFFDDINHNPVITALNLEIVQQVQTIEDKFSLHQERFKEKTFRAIYDKNEMSRMQKAIEKSASVEKIEKRIMIFKNLKRMNIKSKSPMI
jgi:dynein heavy chain